MRRKDLKLIVKNIYEILIGVIGMSSLIALAIVFMVIAGIFI